MKKIDKILIRFVLAFCAIPAFTVSCSDEPLPENYVYGRDGNRLPSEPFR